VPASDSYLVQARHRPCVEERATSAD
jgi:hypothetical protein